MARTSLTGCVNRSTVSIFWAKTSTPESSNTSIARVSPRKSGVRASTAVSGFCAFTAITTSAYREAPPSGKSSRFTEVRTTYFKPINLTARAVLSASAGSSQPCGLPVFTAQNWQARVQTSPINIMVAVPALQHSLILGHLASSQTVAKSLSCTMVFTAA